ncbi:hypothetical protein GCM10011575_34170 [Microlunatus endophyticus]|uniref:Uncharacterized protein n=1 Tax=Microlunatus endophyticus TaxID=1716077 RepID=A0A917W7M9_9ACTN|nr:PRC and DUF2382 domain-containing protein [Microlunatus endophyticus]GGL73030.1 hypothetical protein GCM10011575_34170 [Microlunatus endophyticus]
MTISKQQLPELAGGSGSVYDAQRDKIGRIGQIYLDNENGEPKWVTVSTGLFGTSESFVPLTDAVADGDDIVVAFGKEQVKDAPRIEPDGVLSPEEEHQLYFYYRIEHGDHGHHETAQTVTGDATGNADTVDRDSGNPPASDSDAAMTRSEERLNVGTRTEEVGRVRLRKYVVTENVTQTVPVSHEEVRVEREPITDANRDQALTGPDISEDEHEVVLHQERPVAEKEAVPVERVRLDTDTVTDEESVSEEVRREEVEVEHPDDPDAGRRGTGR